MKWAALTTTDFEAIDRSVPVILNIGAIEQHGPHLPLDTDSLIGRAFLDRLDARAPDRVLILPQVSVCCSAHHMDFSGTLTVRHETLMHYVSDVAASVVRHGFENFVLFNSHGGNLAVGQVILEQIGEKFPNANFFFLTWWQIVAKELSALQESEFGGVGHACEFETSLMAYLAPELLDSEKIPDTRPEPTFAWAEADMLNAPRGAYFRTMKEISGGNGVVGAPGYASREKGEQITELVVDKLAAMAADIYDPANDAKQRREIS